MNPPLISDDHRVFLARPPVFGRPGRIRFRRHHYYGRPFLNPLPGQWVGYGHPYYSYGNPYIDGFPCCF